jgi:trk system potassium uptake protein
VKVIVCGAGQVGFNIARYLAGEDNDVTVVDQSPELTRKIGDSPDIQAIRGFASHPDVLEEAGAGDADMLIAVAQADEVNMVACQVAHSLFNVPMKIARIRNQAYLSPRWQDLFSRAHMPIDVIISPEKEVAKSIARVLRVPGATDMIPFADDQVRLIAVRCGPETPILDTPLRQLTYLFPDLHMVVVGIVRGDHFFVPGDDDQIFAGDEVYFVSETAHVARAMPAFGHEEPEARRVIVVGAGNIGLYLARDLEQENRWATLKVIEVDGSKARAAADKLKRAVILHGDALDREILEEANAQAAEALVAVTNDDEVNVLASLLAKGLGCGRAMALVNNLSYGPLMAPLGIDVVINPRETTVSTILQHVRRGRIRSVYSLHDGAAEVIEADALETSVLVGKALREVHLPAGVIVGAIVRRGQVIIPRGDTVVRTGDRVIVVAMAEMVRRIEKMFSVRLEFF